MIRLWLFTARIAIASSYATLGICDPMQAGVLAWPFGLTVAVIAAWDLAVLWRHAPAQD
jgi:hypothetical protein